MLRVKKSKARQSPVLEISSSKEGVVEALVPSTIACVCSRSHYIYLNALVVVCSHLLVHPEIRSFLNSHYHAIKYNQMTPKGRRKTIL
jgi:hypothetical protein